MTNEQTVAFESATNRHFDSLYGFALVLTDNRDDAHDLVQDAYLRAYRFYSQYAEITNYKACLFALTKNLFINRYHQYAREVSLTELEVVAIPTSPLKKSPWLRAGGTKRASSDTICNGPSQGLPTTPRLAVLLKNVEGLDYREIAELMSCPLGMVMSRLSQGRNLFKKPSVTRGARGRARSHTI